MTRAPAAPLALASALSLAALSTGCPAPCSVDADCPSDQHCNEQRLCDKVCSGNPDCDSSEFCDRGRCTFDARPEVRWLSPSEGAEVGARFDVEVEVRFRAASATVELMRDPQHEGEPCAPFIPRVVTVEGDLDEDVRQRVLFRDVEALGESFGLQARAQAPYSEAYVSRQGFHGPPFEASGAATLVIDAPASDFYDADEALTVDLSAALTGAVGVVSAWVEPQGKSPTPRRVLGDGIAAVSTKMPLARGPQVVWLESNRGGVIQRCGVGLDTLPSANARDLEVGVAFESVEPSNLDLWIYADLDEGGVSRCSADQANGLCDDVRVLGGLRRYGEEAVRLLPLEGIYGVAVASAAATDPVSTFVRVSNRDAHLGFFGPRTVVADQGEVWLAGRILLLGGTFALEPVDAVTAGLPQGSASTW